MSRFGDGVDNCLYKSDIFRETTSNISSGGMGSILYVETTRGKGIILNFKNFNYMHDMFGLF